MTKYIIVSLPKYRKDQGGRGVSKEGGWPMGGLREKGEPLINNKSKR
jgi:hypothetical protein